jgi:hypothetical protein
MYLLGLRQLGHDVYYLEDTRECNFDPEINSPATDCSYALRYIDGALRPFGLEDRWRYIDFKETAFGLADVQWREICSSADLLIVLSGGVWKWRDEYLAIPRKVFIDSDPGFTQLSMQAAAKSAATGGDPPWYTEFFARYNALFTFGSNIGREGNEVPTCGFEWIPTTQPIITSLWASSPLPARTSWTTVMTWKIDSFTNVGGNKDEEFLKIVDLSQRCKASGGPLLELAVNGPADFLKMHGWQCTDAMAVSADLWRYHNYITSSRGEFSVAKHTYVKTHSGWFSDRSACYLAAGKPAVVQETGQSTWLPTGKGLVTWNNVDEAFQGLQQVEADYNFHSIAAQELAREFLSYDKVLPVLLKRAVG